MRELDIAIHKGRKDMPAVIFIHGLSMDKSIWVDPLNTKMFAGNVPLNVFAAKRPRPAAVRSGRKLTFGDIPESVDHLWSVLKGLGFSLICWSQRRPVGPISVAVEEMEEIFRTVKRDLPGRPLAIIGHSRGGLVARKFMEIRNVEIKALITISTPHSGSSLALLRKYLKPMSSVLRPIVPEDARGPVAGILKRLNELIEGSATRELLPGSDFFRGLKDVAQPGVTYFSFGGTRTKLVTLYSSQKSRDRFYFKPVLMIPDSFLRVFPSTALPDELVTGKGDFLVTARSSVLPWANEHFDIPANHLSILWHRSVIKRIVQILNTLK